MQPTSDTQRDARPSATPDASPDAPDAAARTSVGRRTGAALAAASMAVSLCALVAACSMPKHLDADAPPPDPFNRAATQLLDNTDWQLRGWKVAGGGTRDVPGAASDAGAEPITLVLSAQTGQRRASGFSGCNRYTGTYSLAEGKLSFGPLAGTRMACATPGGKIEGAYLSALAHIEHSGVDMRKPQQLQLILDNGDTLVFARRGQ
jgi:heat shock protein HslJ